MKADRREILDRAAWRRRARVNAPINQRATPSAREPEQRKVREPKIVKPPEPKPIKWKKEKLTKANTRPLTAAERSEIQRQVQAASRLKSRPMPKPTTERCPGSGQTTMVDAGHLLQCPVCGQRVGVAPPNQLPEHERPI